MRQYFLIDAVDPLIMSEHSATAGNHQSLDYIPGSAMFGAIAGKLYSTLSASESWDIFHSGGLVMSDFVPVSNGEVGYPTPFAWHVPKVKSADDPIWNLAKVTDKDVGGTQPKQMRTGYVTSRGNQFQVKRDTTTKTAIDADTGVAAESQLFNYQYIQKGQQFLGWVECSEEGLLEKVRELFQQGLRVGRSRGSEFGRIKAHVIEPREIVEFSAADATVTLWCISDACFIDHQGEPTIEPPLRELFADVEILKLDAGKSFVRTKRFSRYNQKRQGYDSEMQVVERGSVYCLTLNRPLTPQELKILQARGLGLHTQLGMGQVLVNPAWASHSNIELSSNDTLFSALTIDLDSRETHLPNEQRSELMKWVLAWSERNTENQVARQQATKLFQRLVGLYRSLRAYQNVPIQHLIGPSKSQWGLVRDTLLKSGSLEQLKKQLFGSQHALCTPANDPQGWGARVYEDGKEKTFEACFSSHIIEPLKSDSYQLVVLNLLEQIGQQDLSESKELKQAENRLKRMVVGEQGGSK